MYLSRLSSLSSTANNDMKSNGFELWRGVSQLDSVSPIVCILTYHSKNSKTGDMCQTWILNQERSPGHVVKRNEDAAICGECIHRTLRTCYVQVWKAPESIWQAWKKGKYPNTTTQDFSTRTLRIGAYGDPAAVPIEVWDEIVPQFKTAIGYTHQWRYYVRLSKYCMASVDTPEERTQAKALGFRTFRVIRTNEQRGSREAQCPASEEAGHLITCTQCRYCDPRNGTGDVAIRAHGVRRRRFNEIPVLRM